MTARVAIVILNWNNAPDTLKCLRSVTQLDYPEHLTLVVDNGSTNDSVQVISEHFPHLVLCKIGQNLGYTGGNNAGIRQAIVAGAEWVFVLNNDVTLAPNALTELMLAAECLPNVGAVGPLVLNADCPQEIQAAGGYFLSGLRYEWRDRGRTDIAGIDGARPADVLPGCALLLSAQALQQTGLFDERFFMYREDIDLCLRLSTQGYGMYMVPKAHLWHRRPGTGAVVAPHVVYYMARNSLLLARKHRPAESIRFLAQDFTACLLWGVRRRWSGMRRHALARADGVKDYFLGRFGRSAKWSP